MPAFEHVLAIFLAYILGSVPTAVWVGKWFYGLDVREYGSGNAGATNVFRVLGKKAGISVLLIDVLKGFVAVTLARLYSGAEVGSEAFVNFQLALGIAALVGHIFPVFVGFRGGKGIATLLGVMIAVHYQAAGLALCIFLLVFLTTRYVSLGSMVAAVSFPLIIIFIYKTTITSLIVFSVFIALVVLITHQKNIECLIRRNESKANLRLIRSGRKGSDKAEDEEDE